MGKNLTDAFEVGSANGLLELATVRRERQELSAEWLFWREFVETFLATLAHTPDVTDPTQRLEVTAPVSYLAGLTLRIPAMQGAEYATEEFFGSLWGELTELARTEAQAAGGLKPWLHRIHPSLHLLGRVTFHLVENKRSAETPFAFMATYTHRLGAQDKPVHLPMGRALQEYVGTKNQAALRTLLEPVQLAAEKSPWTRDLLESRKLFQPQVWTPTLAYAFLREVPLLESSGILVRIPNWWRNGRGPRPQVRVSVGGQVKGSELGLNSLLDFSIESTLGGEPLTSAEWEALMKAESRLVPLRGQWVEVDREKLAGVLAHWKKVAKQASADGISFLEGMRLLSGVNLTERTPADDTAAVQAEWSEVVAGDALRAKLEAIRNPDLAAAFNPNADLHATLRPYQSTGVKWLWLLQSLGLGACLADDMGLGKTIQVIALLLQLKQTPQDTSQSPKSQNSPTPTVPSLLIAPASLLANWKSELTRFAPSLQVAFAHPSESPTGDWRDASTHPQFLRGKDLIVTTYGQATRLEWMAKASWNLVVLDEAQAIKNPGARQTQAIKSLRARARIALSGTPVENRLGDLWSLYDFLNPGLLGTATEFNRYIKGLQATTPPNFAPLRQLVRPYLLRRLKTDRSILPDLPDKTEVTSWCTLGKRQAALYQSSVMELASRLDSVEAGIQRRGLVLAFLMRFKQICNHPSHWLGDGAFTAAESGKFARLDELCEEIASRGEKVLIFTQFREMTDALANHLRSVFGRPGLVLDGSTPVKTRQRLVEQFQREEGPPFFVLSLKAGGTGLNLTAASHVLHFDRWWNPAVESQATDRAFRIGQKRNVLVHKFVCRGTIEERIDALIRDKRVLANSVLGADGGPEALLTEMSNEELLRFVALDLKSATSE